jgi:hypothetical protein
LTTRSDEGPDFEPDDPLAVILRPDSDVLGAPPGRYGAVRRGAARRRLRRTAAGVGLSCAVAALVALPFHLAAPERPAPPVLPLAPPPVSSPSAPRTPPAVPTPSALPESTGPRPGDSPGTRTGPSVAADPGPGTGGGSGAGPGGVSR